MHIVYPPKFCISTVLDFCWGECNTQEKLETVVMHFVFGVGANKVLDGLPPSLDAH